MPTDLKAVVFRTSRLKETKDLFVTDMGMSIKESSATHFVIHSKGIRILFVESDNNVEVELYLSKVLRPSRKKTFTLHSRQKKSGFTIYQDPNGIKIIISAAPDK